MLSSVMIETQCANCNTPIRVKNKTYKESGNFCSKDCFYKSGRERPKSKTGGNKVCPVCLSVFYVSKSRFDAAIYCSQKCKGIASRHAEKPCEICGKIFRPHFGRKNQRCCSRACGAQLRKNGELRQCGYCKKELYVTQADMKPVNYCCKPCADKARSQKDKYVCQVCGSDFYWSPSRASFNPKYCSQACRNESPEWHQVMIKNNLLQQNKKGLNRLELAGRNILEEIGCDFQEQVLLFDKFLVDVFIPSHNIVIQWDGDYWHGRNGASDDRQKKRKALDKSQDAYMTKSGVTVLRFWESEVKNERSKVVEIISRAVR